MLRLHSLFRSTSNGAELLCVGVLAVAADDAQRGTPRQKEEALSFLAGTCGCVSFWLDQIDAGDETRRLLRLTT